VREIKEGNIYKEISFSLVESTGIGHLSTQVTLDEPENMQGISLKHYFRINI